jgi:hypothetical protein
MNRAAIGLLALAAVFSFAGPIVAQPPVPHVIKIQGFLTDGQSAPIDGIVTMTFDLYNAPVGGTLINAAGPLSVEVTAGVYEAALGFTSTDFAGPDRFLEHVINGEVLSPRTRIVSAPYALVTEQGDGLNCWDLNADGICNVSAEDHNADVLCNALDCQGDQGADGPPGPEGPPGSEGPEGPPGIAGLDYGCGDYECPAYNTCWLTLTCDLPEEIVFNCGLNLPGASLSQRSRVTLNRSGPIADSEWTVEATNDNSSAITYRACGSCVVIQDTSATNEAQPRPRLTFKFGSQPADG